MAGQLPVVVTFDELVPRDPSFAEVAEALSAPTRPGESRSLKARIVGVRIHP